jgi:HIV Tat-specific factor 1
MSEFVGALELNKRKQPPCDMSNNAPPSAVAGASASAQAAAFSEDDRVHFSRETGTWRLENDDGTELEYNSTKGWVPVVSAKPLRRR